MFRIGADNIKVPLAAGHLALLASWFYGSSHLHTMVFIELHPPKKKHPFLISMQSEFVCGRISRVGLIPIDYPAFGKVVRAHFHFHFVSRQKAYVIHAHFSGQVPEDSLTGIEFNTKRAGWQELIHHPLNNDKILGR